MTLVCALATGLGFEECHAAASISQQTILILGDSLAAEYGIRRGTGWPALLAGRLLSAKQAMKVVNASVSGETTSGGLRRLPALLDEHRPAWVVIELGANDGLRGLALAAMKANLLAMIRLAQDHHAKVLIIGMRIPPNYGRDYSERFAQIYTELGHEQKLPLVPFLFEGIATRLELFQPDRLHPTEAAQPLLLDTVWKVLKPQLDAKYSGLK
jgi:acyl-CoA thioesterase-1